MSRFDELQAANRRYAQSFTLEQSVRDDVNALRSSPLIPSGIQVTGAIYDVRTGTLKTIV